VTIFVEVQFVFTQSESLITQITFNDDACTTGAAPFAGLVDTTLGAAVTVD
jgi:hypothetical protein